MSDFFRNYPTMFYNIEKKKPIVGTRSTNILSRVSINSQIFNNVFTYYPYRVKEYERPDTIAAKYYGSTDYTFLIFLANKIQDPIYEWPLFGKDLLNFINFKYGSVDSAKSTIHHYEQILRNESFATADNAKILEKVAVVDKDTYDDLDEGEKRIVYNYDNVIKENNAKKDIVLVEDVYASSILNELRNIYA